MRSLSRWLAQSPMTEPGERSSAFEVLPRDVASLNRVVQGLLVHCAWLGSYGEDPAAFGPASRATLPVAQRLAVLLEGDASGLTRSRPPVRREIGTCRDFALLLCSFLRAAGTAARIRCGFASYFAETWEDHWVCEYWNGNENRWCLSDAQLDGVIRNMRGITFNTSDMPRDVFLTAGEAWLRCRGGHDDPGRFGQGDTRGLWYMKVNVVRDALAVNNREISPWDGWRDAAAEFRTVSDGEMSVLDRLARDPEQVVDLMPSWSSNVTLRSS